MSAAAIEASAGPARLVRRLLGELPPGVRAPMFDAARLRPGQLHLGCGAFHRAHQAVYTHKAIEAECIATGRSDPPPWGIVAASLRSCGVVDALRRQDGVYSVVERGDDGPRVEVVASVVGTVYAPDEAARLARWFADPAIRVVTLTVTPAGYCIDTVTGRLDPQHPEVVADVGRAAPTSAIGLLVQGLARRRAIGGPPPVVLSCDNLAHNGSMLRRVCIDFAGLQDDGLSEWMERNVRFPNTMVDRIVPAASLQDRRAAAEVLGLEDDAVVCAEPYRQWVIEAFDGPRPRWDAVGAQFVDDVAPWEASKLRLLNGGHLAVAFLGLLRGLDTVAQAMAQPDLAAFALRFMLDEQRPTLPPSDHDITAYAHQLLHRWKNPAIVHRFERIARDSGKKLAPRLLDSLRDNGAAQRPAPCTVLAVAAWMCCVGKDAAGELAPSRRHRRPLLGDEECAPHRKRLGLAWHVGSESLVDRFLEIRPVFGDDLPGCPGLRDRLVAAVRDLREQGVQGAVERCLGAMS